MTEYGRGSGSEPWYPDDPLYGDQGRPAGGETVSGQQPQSPSWDPHGGQQQYQQYPQYPQQQYQQPYQQPYSYDYQPQRPAAAGWDTTGQYYQPGAYEQQPAGPFATGQHPDPYGGQYGYAPPVQQQPHQPPPQPYPHGPGEPPRAQGARARTRHEGPGPDPETGWDPGPDQGEEDFFSRRDDEDDDRDQSRGRRGSRREEGRPRKRRSRFGCLALALLLVLGAAAAGYYGLREYQERFGAAPDYTGDGTGQVEVEIPEGATTSQIGNILKENGVVKSHDAFVEAAATDETAAQSIQPGVYYLREQMSGESAFAMLTDPSSLNVLTIPEGWQATQIYAAIDEKLGLREGTTEQTAADSDLGLPDWAEEDPEGFLFPARYSVGENTTALDLLREMVDRAEAEYEEMDLESQAQQAGMTAREVLTIASLIQAEAQEDEDFGKVSRVIYNRLEIDMKLQFDSTVNYALGRSTLNVSVDDTQVDSPYNTYQVYGLPPGPIDNPGQQAIDAALNPSQGDWLYFVTVKPGDTRFTSDHAEHEQNVEDFNEEQAQQQGGE